MNKIQKSLSNLGIDKLNEMQVESCSVIKDNTNTIVLSPTGSGKTIAFLLPVLELLNPELTSVQALVIVPSRELAIQIEKVWKRMNTGFKVNVCYGGHSIDTEINNLSNPPALLIGTPGRLLDHLERQSFDTETIETLVLDEFDKSLELGFQNQMEDILSRLSNLKKRVLTSATSAIEIPGFLSFDNYQTLDYLEQNKVEGLSYRLILSPEKDKIETLSNLICNLDSEPALIFCNHREVAERVSGLLNEKDILANYYHGGMDQDDRERILIQFRNGSLRYLVTTDLAARGLDIPEMKNVIHYHLPSKESEFVHRNGRTARMHASGIAYVVLFEKDAAPEYIPSDIQIQKLKEARPLPLAPDFQTIYVSGGKKNKLGKNDIVGFFLQKGKLEKADLGLIEVKDFITFVAVRSSKVKALLNELKDQKMKGKKYKIEVAKSAMKKKKE